MTWRRVMREPALGCGGRLVCIARLHGAGAPGREGCASLEILAAPLQLGVPEARWTCGVLVGPAGRHGIGSDRPVHSFQLAYQRGDVYTVTGSDNLLVPPRAGRHETRRG